ncbi:M24 family metallopeptidase [Brevibacillus borstelensis]|uniref:M24 family metallopeptidase n=1 Tax=Brevibacillus borstelensis TaxID=45462 RepID=UPI0030BED7BF
MFDKRQQALAGKLREAQVEAAVLVPGPNLYYFTGLQLKQSERLTLAIVTQAGKWLFITPQVELSKVQSTVQGEIFWYTDEQGSAKALQELVAAKGKLGKVGVEFGGMRVTELKAVEQLGSTDAQDVSKLFDSFRMCKDEEEIEYLRKAVAIVEESLEATLPYIKPGVIELEIAAQLEYEMRKRGSEGTPFGTIVASGYRGALPHGRAASKKIEAGELVVLDFGAIYGGYVADITRTVAVGAISDELKLIYETVREAQQAAIDIIKPGITAHEVDDKARSIISSKGFGTYFTHRTGHGIGLGAHEAPYMMQNNQLVLEPGMAFTVEPGIYLPDKGGVRIEDNIIVTKDGYLNLMTSTKELITL